MYVQKLKKDEKNQNSLFFQTQWRNNAARLQPVSLNAYQIEIETQTTLFELQQLSNFTFLQTHVIHVGKFEVHIMPLSEKEHNVTW